MIGGLAFSYWKFVYLPQIIPVVPVPYGAKLVDHSEWSTSEVLWYQDTYEVETSPQNIEIFYKTNQSECSQYYRGFVDKKGFLASCSGFAKPTGWYYLEIEAVDLGSRTRIIIEVGWEAGL